MEKFIDRKLLFMKKNAGMEIPGAGTTK